jgi:tetratricopeptide (TPR) repeat protein
MKTPVTRRPNASPLFVGRNDVLDKLRKIFIQCQCADSKLMSRRSCLLWGTGGIGKTQICLKFIEEISGRLSHVFWIDASSEESITMSLRGISSISAAQASCLDDSVDSVLQWMSDIQEEWLIVFDNADNPPVYVVEKFIPPGYGGNILITSRNRSMGRVVSSENIIEIDEMEEADAVTLLLKASCLDASDDHEKVAKNIVTELGCIPLAVDQAGAYIEAGRCSIHKYLQQFSLHRQTLMTDVTFRGASNYDQTVYGTWDLSFKEIKKMASGQSSTGDAQAAHAAILILQICAFYHHSNISKDIFRSAAEESREVDSEVAENLPLAMSLLDRTLLALDNNGHWDEFIFGQGIAVLLSFSLMKRDKSSEMLSVHPLVHCWSREQISKSEQQRMYEMGSIILCCAISQGLSSYDYGLRQLIFQHIKASESYGSQIGLSKKYYDDKWENFIFVIRENGGWEHAEQLGVQVMDMRKKVLGAEHPDTLLSMTNLATTYADMGNLHQAEQLESQVFNMRKKLLGTEHPDILESMANLATIYSKKGKWNEAEQLEVQVLNMRKKVLGAEHPDTLLSMANLATTYSKKRKWDEAEQLEVQVLVMRKKVLGAEHPDTLISMANLAATYADKGKWNEAEQLEVQVLDMRKKVLGAHHPDTLRSMENLATTYADKGKWNEAEQLEVQVLDMRKKVLGAEHPDTLRSMAHLAATYADKGKWNEAEQLEVQVLDMRKKVLGTEHPDTLISMENLARTYIDMGNLIQAELLEIQVLDMRKKLLGTEHPDILESMTNLVTTYLSQGKWNEAEQLELQMLDMRKNVLDAQHPNTLKSMANPATYLSEEVE